MLAERRLPPWFKVKFPGGPNYLRLKALMRLQGLHTICEEARCPNIGECWEYGTATFMILGEICTRRCAYCNVTTGRPNPVDPAEPRRVAEAAKAMALRYAVVTSPNRDDLPDGGAAIFAATIAEIRALNPACKVEVLIPDFMGVERDLLTVLDASPDVLNHNIETVAGLFKRVRPKGSYDRSIRLLADVKRHRPTMTTKSGIILGMGETDDQVLETMADLREADCDILTLGQYLRPSDKHIPVARFLAPDQFASLKSRGLAMGFKHVESGPLVRSSYHAHEHAESAAAIA
ncbi:MAG: lipoyl synthase [Chloroflexi bacterium]|nr:lipoyl synthase [Chloroflexota bacterium]